PMGCGDGHDRGFSSSVARRISFTRRRPVQSTISKNAIRRRKMISASELLLPLSTIADRLHYTGRDRDRSVRRLFKRHGVPMIRRGRGASFVTEQQYAELIEKITC